MNLILRQAQLSDEKAVHRLLQECSLPSEDIHNHMMHFHVLEKDDSIIGLGGLEVYDTLGLLRSLAIIPKYQGRGLGRRMCRHMEDYAVSLGIKTLYLLTESAQPYFKTLGYRFQARADAPPPIKKTAQFTTLCSCSASLMFRVISEETLR